MKDEDFLECPCCGDVGAYGPLYEDGTEAICGCATWVSCDTENLAEMTGPEDPCPEGARCNQRNPFDQQVAHLLAQRDAWRESAEAWEVAYNGALAVSVKMGDARGLARLASAAIKKFGAARALEKSVECEDHREVECPGCCSVGCPECEQCDCKVGQ